MATITLHGYDFELDAEDLVPLTEIWRKAGKPKGKEPWRFKDLARIKCWLNLNNPCRVPWKGVRGKGTWVGQSLLITWYIEWLRLEYKPTDPESESAAPADDDWLEKAKERARERMAKQEAEEATRKPAEPETRPEPDSTDDSGSGQEYVGEGWKGAYDPDTAGEEWKGEGYDHRDQGEEWKGEPEPRPEPAKQARDERGFCYEWIMNPCMN
jgi:hypothetical protein